MIMNKKPAIIFCFFMALAKPMMAQVISNQAGTGRFPIINSTTTATVYTDEKDFTVVQKVTALFQTDIEAVTGKHIDHSHQLVQSNQTVIIVGTIGHCAWIDQLIQKNKISVAAIKDKWEAFGIFSIAQPFPHVGKALVVAGSDRRGTAYGVFELSRQIGVSPWYWWADVPVKKKKEIYIKENSSMTDAPGVKYRGIFINDEAPALSGWTKENFGGFNHRFYEKVFELLLRLKGNYIWPAMWGNAFFDDDSLDKKTADDYAIVIGTSHHEPLMRAHDEWRRYGSGKWDYDSNEVTLKKFWRAGIERMDGLESMVTVGMRGDGDKPMSEGTAISLLERIVKDQREIIREVTQKTGQRNSAAMGTL